ncbi:hypothetical protein LTR84_004962 [Exophiala bonariae]|uniref:Adhesin domain-containing protein n=1 Tax=Exophiala bonariae TaxID=1690606 RepID=A0AAV9NNW6_9EURO|nr:hypothetical protein LTR84_004962 [Exophiala bonariae]
MTKRKQYPLRGYDTFEEESHSGTAGSSDNHPISYQREDSDKSRSAAAEAQRLGSMGSWADQYSGGRTPATNMTPTASTVNGDDDNPQNLQYPRFLHDSDPSDPPPVYTPEASTNGTAAPPSPVALRVAPAFQPVSNPVTDDSSQNPSQSGSQSQARRQSSSSCPYQVDNEDADDPSASLLPEPVQYPYQQGCSQPSTTPLPPNERISSKKRWCLPRHTHRRVAFRRQDPKCRARRFKRTCWFIFSLLLCLWLLIPGLCKSLSNKGETQFPDVGSFPVPRREYRQHESSQSITGTYPLYDLLDLSTKSGSISITVDIQPGDRPAVLKLSSTSGSINVRMVPASNQGIWSFWKKSTGGEKTQQRVENLDRVFKTDISTKSGSVGGTVVHGNGGTTSISTGSGSHSISIYPVGVSGNDPSSTLTTTAGSGSQNVKILSPNSVAGYQTTTSTIRSLKVSHTTTGSGSINVVYPGEWEGQLHVLLQGSGSINARGQGLQTQQQGRHELFGWKGVDSENASSVQITERGSGSVNFQC